MRKWRCGAHNSLDSLFSFDLLFLLSPYFTNSLNQQTPQLPSFSRTDGVPTTLICPLTSGSASSSTSLPHRGNCKPIDITWISCSWFWFLISKHLTYNSPWNANSYFKYNMGIIPHSSEVSGLFHEEALMPYYHFLELCLEFRPAGQSVISWIGNCYGQPDFLTKAGKCLAELTSEHLLPL